jgi:uncharacterized protein
LEQNWQAVAMEVAITGSHGLIGTALIEALTKSGHTVRRIVRSNGGANDVVWSPTGGSIDAKALAGVDAVVHLAGAGIGDKRWTPAWKTELLESRTKGTTLLSQALADLDRKPAVLLSGSAIGYYGAGDTAVTEESPAGSGFLADLCVQWEASTAVAETAGIRTAHLRTGIVLSTTGGALKKQLPLFKLGLGGKIGSGRQWQSWVSIDDEVGAIMHLLTANVSGPVNITSPNPVTNAEFTTALSHAVHRPAIFPIPGFAPKLLLGSELVENLLLTGQKVMPSRLLADGYPFRHATIEAAFADILQ